MARERLRHLDHDCFGRDPAAGRPAPLAPHDAPTESATARTLLGLQRAAGNQAVLRTLGSTGPVAGSRPVVQRGRYDDIKPADDDFWTDIRTRTVQSLTLWLVNLDRVVNQFETDIRSEGESGGGFSLDTLVNMANDLTGLIKGAGGPWAAAAISLGKGVFDAVYDAVKDKASGGSVNLENFLGGFRQANTDTSKLIDDQSSKLGVFDKLAEYEKGDPGGDGRVAYRSDAKKQLNSAVDTLVTKNPRELARRLIIDWVAASTDTWDTDWGGKDAGAIIYKVSLNASGYWHIQQKPFVDDASRAHGTIVALRRAFDASTPVYDLPIHCSLRITMGAVNAEYHRSALSTPNASGDNHSFWRWEFDEDREYNGRPVLFEYLDDPNSPKPTLADLVED
jgi:hypothetical protein